MLTVILVVFAFVLALLVAASRKPDEFQVSRSATISASSAAVFEQINDLQKWQFWSPWANLDPNAKHTFEGPQAGTGAVMRWQGNNKIGMGSMTITESRPSEYIKMRLDFLKPMKATNTAEYVFKNEGMQTTVTWSMLGKSNLMAKVVSLFINCEKMVGKQFEQGLSEIKRIVESK